MPYISQDRRKELENIVSVISNSGELNYLLTMLCIEYLKDQKNLNNGKMKYQMINDIVGALECAKAEFYRRIAFEHEDKAIERNGDVYNE